MNRLTWIYVTFLIGIIGICNSIPTQCAAQENTGTLSGAVVDKNGKPLKEFYIKIISPFQIVKTDENGSFTFTNVPVEQVQIAIPVQPTNQDQQEVSGQYRFGANKPDDEIVSIKIGSITLFQDRHPPFGGIKFGLKPNSKIENITVTVQPRMRIRARVVFKDGKPLVNTNISHVIVHKDVDGKGSGRSSGGSTTNADGYFVEYIQKDDYPANYTVSVKYKGMSAESNEILIEEGTRYDDLVLTLDGVEPTPKQTPKESPSESLPSLLSKLNKPTEKANKPNDNQPIPPSISRMIQLRMASSSWVVNPANGHAYKKIRCSGLDEAKKMAEAEGGYLVSINEEAEQKWLSGVFGNRLYWIGLTRAETEGEWVWMNGEPLTYKNWGVKQRFPRSSLSAEEKVAGLMTFVDGTWRAVGPEDLLWRSAKQVIIEKDDLQDENTTESK